MADAPVDLRVHTAAISESSTSFAVRVNNQPVASLNILPINESVLAREAFYDSYAYPAANPTVTTAGDNISVQLEYNNSGNPSSEGYLDFVGITPTSQPKITKNENSQNWFQCVSTGLKCIVSEYY